MKDKAVHPRAIVHMQENAARDLPWLVGGPWHQGEWVIVGGAPSILTRMDNIRKRQVDGGTIVALNGANGCLRANGITPDIVLFVDPSEAVAGFITNEEDDEAMYLVASICHPSVFERLKDREVHLWHPEIPGPQLDQQVAILDQYPKKPGSLVGGGSTGALRALHIAGILGYRTIHMYGVDSSYPRGGADHAYTKHDGPEPAPETILFDGKSYCCSRWMVRQADEFRFYYAQLDSLGVRIHVHGDGLLPGICRSLKRAKRASGGNPVPLEMPATIH